IVSSGTISTSGGDAYGILALGENGSIISEGEIVTEGKAAHGLGGSGSGHRLENRGSITTRGDQAQGLAAAILDNRLENYGTVTTFGDHSNGLWIKGSLSQVENDGTIETEGYSSSGISISGSGNRAVNRGAIYTEGELAHGMFATGGNLLLHSGTIETTGEDAYGMFVREGDNGLEIAGDVFSRQAEAVRIGGTFDSDARAVEQSGAAGNRLLLHGSPEIVGDMVNDGADDGATVYFGIAFDEAAPEGYATAPTDFAYEGSFDGQSWQGELVSGRVRLNGGRNAFSLFTVHPGALLGGTTTLAGDLVNNGRIAPGNSIGTINVEGDYHQGAGAVLQMEIGGSQSDKLVVGGDAIFEEGSLLFMEPTAPILGGDFSLLDAEGTISGIPLMNLADTALLDFTLNSGSGALTLQVDRTAYAEIAASGNQRHLGGALDSLLPDASEDLANVLMQIDSLEQDVSVRQTFDALTPTSYAALPDVPFLSMRRFVNALPENVKKSPDEPWSSYARVFSLHARRDAGHGTTGYSLDGHGVLSGLDRRMGDLLVGGALSYQRTEINHDDSGSRSDSDALLTALRAAVHLDRWHVKGELGYGHQWDDNRREIRTLEMVRQAESRNQSDTLYVGMESGRSFYTGPLTLTPFAGLDYAAHFWGGFDENGAEALNVELEHTTADSLRGTWGFLIAAPTDVGRFTLDPQLRLAWGREFADDSYSYRAELEGQSFTVSGRELGRDILQVGLDLRAGLGEKLSAAVSLDYERRGAGDDGYAARGGITWYF
ncbi:MAG: autotransporter domain-containing protein, partial [Desulfuromonadales bacterium]